VLHTVKNQPVISKPTETFVPFVDYDTQPNTTVAFETAAGTIPLQFYQSMAPKKPSIGTGSSRASGMAIQKKATKRKATRPIKLRRLPAPSTQTFAPISIGNTVRGSVSQVVDTKFGKMVHGRDFMFSPIGSGTVTNWTLVGGAPLTPAAFADSTLRQYVQMYNKFRFIQITAHYITSSPTSSNGDIMFYFNKNRESVFLNQTSGNLLPFVISDPNAVLGPQWENASATFQVSSDWKSCDYGIDSSIQDYADGDLFLLSKTSTTDSPGYVLFDYIIEFTEPSITPRLLSLPITRILWFNLALNITSPATVDAPFGWSLAGAPPNLSGTVSTLPPGTTGGDVFKVILDMSNTLRGANSAFVLAPTVQNVSSAGQPSTQTTFIDGSTVYATYSNGVFVLFPSADAAFSNSRPFTSSGTGAVAATLMTWMSYIGSVAALNINPNF
jgi:hypothetical protein